MGDLLKLVLSGVRVSLDPVREYGGHIERVRVSTTKETWNGITTLNRVLERNELERLKDPEERLERMIMDMAEEIEKPFFNR